MAPSNYGPAMAPVQRTEIERTPGRLARFDDYLGKVNLLATGPETSARFAVMR